MRNHWQYLGYVEPVLPTPRTGGVAQWRPMLPDLPKRAPFAVALIAAVCTFVPVLSAAPPPTVDKWGPSLQTPVRRTPHVISALTGAESPLHVVRSRQMTWQVPLSEPRREHARTVTYATGAERSIPAAQAPFTLRWNVPMSEPVRVMPRTVTFSTGAERSLHVVRSQHMTWQVPMSEPRRERPRTVTYAVTEERSPEFPVVVATFQVWWVKSNFLLNRRSPKQS